MKSLFIIGLLFLVVLIESTLGLTSTMHKHFLNWDAAKTIEDTNITLSAVNHANAQVYPVIKEMVATKFFRTFKVDLESECPFWAMERLCGVEGGCSVCKCDEKEVPIPWKITTTHHINRQGLFGRAAGKRLKWNDKNANSWFPSPPESHMTYVNLLNNPEANTGYSSKEASRIWMAIYTENCFQGGDVNAMCFEERFFYRLLSGLHSTITTKIATYHFKKSEFTNPLDGSPPPQVFTYDMWDPNMNMFNFMISFPERLQNMYFLYSTTFRAIQKARDFLLDYDYSTGNATEDQATKHMLTNLLANDKFQLNVTVPHEDDSSCCYDESCLFASSCDADKVNFVAQMQEHFYNISRLMDCVGCEKCRMWAKLQMLGLSVSLRLLLTERSSLSTVTSQLTRNELIALFNSFKQQAQSIDDLQRLLDMAYRRRISHYIAFGYFGFIVVVVLWLLYAVCTKLYRRRFSRRPKKKKRD